MNMSAISEEDLLHPNRHDQGTIFITPDNINSNAAELPQTYYKSEFAFPQIGNNVNTTNNTTNNTNNTNNANSTNDNNASAKRRIKNFSLQEKVQVLDDIKAGRSKVEVRKEHGIGESTLRRWIHDEQKLRDAYRDENANRKKLRTTDDYPYVGEALIAWYNQCKQQNIPTSGLVLREKALELNQMLGGKENFTASTEWFNNWKKKYGLVDITITDETKQIENSALNQLTITLTNAVHEESLLRCQIFKCDKTVLSYKSLPNRRFPGDRITIMSCSNADGSFKLPLVVLGKSVKSTTLVNLQNSLPIFYAHQTSLWMDSDILNEWFDTEFTPRVTEFLKLRSLPLKAILIAENVPSDAFQNRPTSELQIHLVLHNLSLVIGPINNESLQSVKLNYEYKLLKSIISAQDDGVSLADYLQKINLRNCIYWVSQAWDEVKQSTIIKCWKKLLTDNDELFGIPDQQQEVNAMVVLETLRRIHEYRDISPDEVAKWIAENHETSRISIDNHIVEIVVKDSNEDLVDDAENMCEESKIVTAADAINGLNEAILFFEQNGCVTVTEMMTLIKLKDKALNLKINAK